MKRILPIIFIIALLFSSCSNRGDPGQILTVDDKTEITLIENSDEMLFYGGEKPDMEFETYNDYYAGFSIPYPKKWTVRAASPNYITFYDGKTMIVMHHHLLTAEVDWEDNVQIFRESFTSMLNAEKFTLGEYSDIYRRPRQTLDEITIVNEYPPLISERYDNIKMTSGLGDYISGKLSEKRYLLRYNTIDSVISAVTLSENKDDAYKILDYMVGNIRTLGVKYENSGLINTETLSIKIPSTFVRKKIETESVTGFSYAPPDNDAMGGCFFQTYPLVDDLNYEFVDTIFRATIPAARACTYNESTIKNFDTGLNGQSCTCIVADGVENSIAQKGTVWNVEIYYSDDSILVVGYPLAKAHLIQKLSEYQNSGE